MLERMLQIKYINSDCTHLLVADCESLNKQLDNAYNEAKAYTDAIHQYMFYNNSKPLKKYLPIDEKDDEKKDSNF